MVLYVAEWKWIFGLMTDPLVATTFNEHRMVQQLKTTN